MTARQMDVLAANQLFRDVQGAESIQGQEPNRFADRVHVSEH